ncbi:MAG: HAMP domain-containing histidine kinase [Eubacterium sp.]|nr:HAMP domain-containing histidine kinase [Eubacterium sp.]
MKLIKNKIFRLFLYILGYISALFIVISIATLIMRYEYFDESENFKGSYKESVTVSNLIYQALVKEQEKAAVYLEASNSDFAKKELEIYDYEDICKEIKDNKAATCKSYESGEILSGKDVAKELQSFVNMENGQSVSGGFAKQYKKKDNKYIKIRWEDYRSIVHNICTKYDSNYYYDDEEADNSKLSEEDLAKNKLYKDLYDNLYDRGISEGSYFTMVDGYLYVFDANGYIINGKYGTADINLNNYNFNDVYVPYDKEDIEEILKLSGKDAEVALEEYILSSCLIRNDVELVYTCLDNSERSKLENFNKYGIDPYYSGFYTAFSLEGENIDNLLIDSYVVDTYNKKNPEDTTYPELVDIYRENSDIFINYDSKTGKIEQWFKSDSGSIINHEYIDKESLKTLTSKSDNDFVLSFNLDNELANKRIDAVIYELCKKISSPVEILVLSIIFFIIVVVILIWGEKARLLKVDKFPYIVWWIIVSIPYICFGSLISAFSYYSQSNRIIFEEYGGLVAALLFMGLVIYLATAALVMNMVRRIKCNQFLNGFITVLILKYLFGSYKGLKSRLRGRTRFIIFSVFLFVANFLAYMIIACNGFQPELVILALAMIIIDAIAIGIVLRYMTDMKVLLETSKRIEDGQLDAKVNIDELVFDSKDMGLSLNRLGDGLSKAVESSLRDERTKAELITNVSHDIKTPLTSIINYVDLLKKEDIDNDKAREYIEVLDKKSDRLKQLILDLIEASKTSTGNIEMEYMNLNFNELINQCIGEFEDKFKEKNLEIVPNLLDENVIIYADGRRVFRIIDNLLNNVVKYGQPGTRVYIDLKENNSNLRFSIKNVSKEMLNISADELTERFVRGDRSRNTEGSGLGLSIAKNLTELQGGTFNIIIDGDFFRVDVIFPAVNNKETDSSENT